MVVSVGPMIWWAISTSAAAVCHLLKFNDFLRFSVPPLRQCDKSRASTSLSSSLLLLWPQLQVMVMAGARCVRCSANRFGHRCANTSATATATAAAAGNGNDDES